MGKTFIKKMAESAKRKKSSVVLALDKVLSGEKKCIENYLHMLELVYPYICGLKLNRQVTLSFRASNGISQILKKAHNLDLPVIMDCKINDIGYTNEVIAEHYYNLGFDAITANPIVGWEEGLQKVFEIARKKDRGVLILVYMSHKSAGEGYGQIIFNQKKEKLEPQYLNFARKTLSWKADGAIVGATYPHKIREIFKILNQYVPIYSPGVDTQGGEASAAIQSGSKFLIIGRSITLADNPQKVAKIYMKKSQMNSSSVC